MKKTLLLLCLSMNSWGQDFRASIVPGEFIVKLKENVVHSADLASGAIKPLGKSGFALLKEGVLTASARANFEYVEPNYIYHASTVPNDPSFSSLWGMQIMDMPKVWDKLTASDVKIAVVDTGIDYTHQDLFLNAPGPGFNAITGKEDGMDDQGHGTHCAGTIAAIGGNFEGVVGVNWKAEVLPAKFLDSSGSGSTANAITAIDWALKQGAKVFSNSWGGGGSSKALEDMIKKVCNAGGVFIAAAGNSKSNNDLSPTYPASYDLPCVISVAATDQDDKLADFSNYGKSVSIAAPGVAILSTIPGNRYASYSGTSMATPHVAGVVALMLTKEPTLSAQTILSTLQKTADPVNLECPWWRKWWGGCKTLGGGRLNAFKALSAL